MRLFERRENGFRLTSRAGIFLLVLLEFLVVPVPQALSLDFEDVEAGLRYESTTGERGGAPAPNFIDNEGIYVLDFNRDFRPDLFVTGARQPALFANEGGTFKRSDRFPDVEFKVSSALAVDYNQDDWTDLVLIPRTGTITLFRNNEGTFEYDHKLNGPQLREGIGGAVGDFDSDGCPDLFVIQYNDKFRATPSSLKDSRLDTESEGSRPDNGLRNFLLQGDCNSFSSVPREVFHRGHWSLATSIVDVNGDNRPDVHVANDFYRDSLYINKGEFRFDHRYLSPATDRNGMASEIINLTRNEQPDLFVSNILYDPENPVLRTDEFISSKVLNPLGHNTLENEGSGNFSDHARTYNLRKGGWGWAASRGDFDNDFDFELFLGRQNLLGVAVTLNRFDLQDIRVAKFIGKYRGRTPIEPERLSENSFYGNFSEWLGHPALWDRTGDRYTRKHPVEWEFGRLNARGVARLDYDGDGRLDLAVAQFGRKHKLFRNRSSDSEPWLRLSVEDAFQGGDVVVSLTDRSRRVFLGKKNDFHSQETPFYHFGLPAGTESIPRITVRWNDGSRRQFENLSVNQFLHLSKNDSPQKITTGQ